MRIIAMLLVLSSFAALGQSDSTKKQDTDSTVYEMFAVSKQAEFPGGDEGLRKFLSENISYPDSALKNETIGVVVLRFIVTSTGEVDKIEVLTPAKGDGLEEESIRVIELTSGMWSPAMQRDKAVAVRYQIPINFQIY